MIKKRPLGITVYFDGEDQLKLYNAIRKRVFQKRADSISGELKAIAYQKYLKNGLIK